MKILEFDLLVVIYSIYFHEYEAINGLQYIV
ncbi:hypothetical protein ABG79_00737 [Caloramator mitchellensis]|uniref:Uncharacterized protein n=1 Tax=Caloramator mitchellensis TaxID=908809 RepID=A0A0R3JV06_CALMK|nr:hypothetical protein ABG79_00737 [Caloramator mitchellensis]